ncbi:MAG: hypothetical protein COB93_05265 [Sneathiella sp.]|nr:MAG: hypothetical protein COB93_05265 [Sneathiella sp.]
MILTCSTCSTRYSIDPISIPAEGRAVKCAKCGHKWREFPPGDMLKPVSEVLDDEDNADAPAAETSEGLSIEQMTASQPSSVQRAGLPKKRKWIGWLVLILVVVAIGLVGFYGRNFVVQIWPDSAKFYQSLQIDVETTNNLGLEIHDLQTKSVLQNGVTTLTVTGVVKNITEEPQPMPRIGVALIDEMGERVYSWTTTVEAREVEPWGQVEFSTSMNQPPEDAKNVKVDLIEIGK